ncbi:MAG: histidinol dehydrogenase, partial [Deltaproteobacteria bacterium]|nr:histidinol dehydrogenase [Deltaproteobacteria bacterium]
IKEYHQKQVTTGYTCEKEPGVLLGQKVLPLERVGIYAPGGLASYPSTILMAAIPARIAGVDEIILCSPQRSGEINPLIAYATKLCTIDKFFRVGGAQAIAALSYGTETIPQVDKIVGPGNAYVACAKKLVFGQVDIDMVAGPSEVMIIADDLAIPAYIASDMLAQAEHDERASSIIVTTSEELAVDVAGAIALQLANMDTAQIARQALSKNGLVVIVRDIAEAVAIANDFAPEHLEIMAKNPRRLLGKIRNAGSVFLGDYSPEALGDYLAGANHILPTSGTARFASPLGVYSFTKRMSFLSFSQEAFRKLASATATLAQAEGLTAHANSVRIRTQHLREKRKESV